jgi:hypothetical protein
MGIDREDALNIANTVGKLLVRTTGYCRITTGIRSLRSSDLGGESVN